MTAMIETFDLGKRYRIGGYRANVLRERLAMALRNIFTRTGENSTDFWALRNISVRIGEGDVVGLIGRNGAGKSTFLKLLSHITEPTEGEAHLRGRVASLLEVGVGFHPELTGRENIHLNGAILGMSRAETRRKFDEIVQFAEIEKFLETPVKRYSSGMYVRLAFAVAAHLDPDILIVDEVLGVGDTAFQQKCLNKMRGIHDAGKTVIVVSHNMSTIASLCQTVIWLKDGQLAAQGPTNQILGRYLSQGLQNDLIWIPRDPRTTPLEIHSVSVVAENTAEKRGEANEAIAADTPIDVMFDFTIHEWFPPGHLEVRVMNDLGEVLLTSSSADGMRQANHEWHIGRQTFRCRIPGNLLAPGRYFLSILEPVVTHDRLRANVVSFAVSEQNSLLGHGERQGKIAPLLEWVKQPVAG
jgi:lipopolysaccharide transport system ATP-binding protein